MFTGIVREIGTVESVERDGAGARIRVSASLAAELGQGDSVSVAGRLPHRRIERQMTSFEADLMNQTLSADHSRQARAEPTRSTSEPALRAGEPLGGHLVQGHVDGAGDVVASSEDGLLAPAPASLRRPSSTGYLVEHGSVAVDGVSLTVAGLADDGSRSR